MSSNKTFDSNQLELEEACGEVYVDLYRSNLADCLCLGGLYGTTNLSGYWGVADLLRANDTLHGDSSYQHSDAKQSIARAPDDLLLRGRSSAPAIASLDADSYPNFD